jgi:hypothetical protein
MGSKRWFLSTFQLGTVIARGEGMKLQHPVAAVLILLVGCAGHSTDGGSAGGGSSNGGDGGAGGGELDGPGGSRTSGGDTGTGGNELGGGSGGGEFNGSGGKASSGGFNGESGGTDNFGGAIDASSCHSTIKPWRRTARARPSRAVREMMGTIAVS